MYQKESSTYKFERKFNKNEIYQVKLTLESIEDIENLKNIDEVFLDINNKIGTFSIPQKNNLSKVFNLNIEPITRGAKESLEVNIFRSNKTIESIASLNVRLNVQATSKIYDMTKRKMAEIEQENKKHSAKELKLPLCSNKNSAAFKVFQNKEIRSSNQSSKRSIISDNFIHLDNKRSPEFTIREKVLHLLVLKPTSKDALLLSLHKLGVASNDRCEVEKMLQQIATLNKDNMYQLSNQFIFEIRDDWPHFDEISRNKIARLKADIKPKIQSQLNNGQAPNHTIQRNVLPFNDNAERHGFKKSLSNTHTASNIVTNSKVIIETGKVVKIPEKLFNSKSIPEHENKKQISMPKSGRQTIISPTESNSSCKTGISNDEGFCSGDKTSPIKLHNDIQQTKRRSHNVSNNSTNDPACKKIHLSDKNSRNDINSSSSCDVTPTSDASLSSNESKPDIIINKLYEQSSGDIKMNTNFDLDDIQMKFNISFEEYSQLCNKLKEREAKIEKLRTKSMNAKTSDYVKIFKIAKTLLDEMETSQFQEMTARVKILETELSKYVRILTCLQ